MNFRNELIENLKNNLSGYDVTEVTVTKCNDTFKEAVTIRKDSKSYGITLYFEDMERAIRQGKTIEEVVGNVVERVKLDGENVSFMDSAVKVITNINTFDDVEDKIILRLINSESNKEYLSKAPFVDFYDLKVAFYILLECAGNNEAGTVLVNNEMLKRWGKTPTELYNIALKNTENKYPRNLMGMIDVVKNMLKNEDEDIVPDLGEGPGMMVLSNVNGFYGAAAILYTGALREAAELVGTDYLTILPSSVHETILVPIKPTPEYLITLKEMVQEVNSTQVAPEEVLSSSVYLYSKEQDKIERLD